MKAICSNVQRGKPVGKIGCGAEEPRPRMQVNAAPPHLRPPAVQAAKYAFGRIALQAGSAILEDGV
ncbi:MAG: hypothetical protein RL341_2219 [Pseudomonadota bacterium]|jgi:hypothetical protein